MKKRMNQILAAILMASMVAVEALSMNAYAAEESGMQTEETGEAQPETEEEEVVEVPVKEIEEPLGDEKEDEPEAEEEVQKPKKAEDEKSSSSKVATYAASGDEGTDDTLSEPSMSSVDVEDGKITVKWGKVSSATGYKVYRSTNGGSSWSSLTTTTSTSYKDTSVKYGNAYTYTVQATGSKNSSYGNNKLTAAYLEKPKSVTMNVGNGGLKVSWKKVTGASGYGIYRRKSSESSYTLVKMVNSGSTLSCTDTKSLSSGTTYYYQVRAYKGDASAAEKNAKKVQYWGFASSKAEAIYLAAPTSIKAKSVSNGTKVSWKKVSGAKGYVVYRKKGTSGSWKQLATTTKTSYSDTASLSAGKTYYYSVRAYRSSLSKANKNKYSPMYWSYRDGTGAKSIYLKAPSLKRTENTESGVKITFSKVTGAKGYGVLRRKGKKGSWKLIGTTTKASYTDTSSLKTGSTYYYRVRPYAGTASTAKANKYDAQYWGNYKTSSLSYEYTKDTVAMDKKTKSYSSNTQYLIMVNCKTNRLGIYTGSKGNWTRKYYWKCSTGKSSTPSKKGQFTVGSKGKSFGTSTYTCWYYTQWSGNYLFHSVLYYPGSMTRIKHGKLGANLSHGCVRLDISNAKWIYDYIPRGTKVVVY